MIMARSTYHNGAVHFHGIREFEIKGLHFCRDTVARRVRRVQRQGIAAVHNPHAVVRCIAAIDFDWSCREKGGNLLDETG